MKRTNQQDYHSGLNLRPAGLAAEWVTQELYPLEDILLQPAEGIRSEQHREIVEVKEMPKGRGLAIYSKTKSDHRQQLEQAAVSAGWLQEGLAAIDREFSRLRIMLALREREHRLGLSPIQEKFYCDVQHWASPQRAVLAFFLPYQSLIRRDRHLLEQCLQTALAQPVRLTEGKARRRRIDGAPLNGCSLNSAAPVGGPGYSPLPCLDIRIGPIDPAELEAFAPGGRRRRFLEQGLLPAFLPPGYDWRIRLTVAGTQPGLRLADEGSPARLNINSTIE